MGILSYNAIIINIVSLLEHFGVVVIVRCDVYVMFLNETLLATITLFYALYLILNDHYYLFKI